jgi:peptidoglycan/xylan/chitin deacetylase (PgdA/CDA1 family)
MKTYRSLITITLLVALLIFSWFTHGIRQVATEQKVVALTFDDGPNPPYTTQLLQILEEKQVRATFFLIGQQVTAHPEPAQLILKGGHEIGGHSSDWKSLAFETQESLEGKLRDMDAAFESVGATHVSLFRPPSGFLFPWQRKMVAEHGLTHISANVVAGDWKDVDTRTICKRVLKKVRPGSIIVLHDGGGDRSATIAAVPQIIEALQKRGYTFLTVGELLKLRTNI